MLDGEQKLIREAMRKEGASAFGELYDHYHPKIYRFVYLKVSNREEAEDITHHVFLSAWQNIKKYRFQGFPFSSWLYHIARNKVIDHYRSATHHSPIESTEVERIATPENVMESADASLSREHIQLAISRLPADQQDIVIMRFVEDMSHKEIAAVLQKTEGAVKVMQHRTLKRLKAMLKNGPTDINTI